MIVPASKLTVAEMRRLGNNVYPTYLKDRGELPAVNRSLVAHGEEIDSLSPMQTAMGKT